MPADPLNPVKLSRPRVPALALGVEDAAKALSLCPSTVRKLIDTGELGHVRIGKRVLLPVDELRSFLKRSTKLEGGAQ